MRLGELFAAIAPLLDGRAGAAEVAAALYPADPGGIDARRLGIYGRFCRFHRLEAVEGVHARTRAAVVALAGEPRWRALVEAYVAAHPMREFELNANGAAFAAWLATADMGLPSWVAELADLEWWVWQTAVAPDDPADSEEPAGGALRLAGTVEARPYRHDLVAWLDDGVAGTAPAARAVIVLFWRDRDLDARRENATPVELAVLQAVSAGAPPPAGTEATALDLRAAGILLGSG